MQLGTDSARKSLWIRTICVLLIMAVLLAYVPVRATTSTPEERVVEAIFALQDEYPDGMVWNNQSPGKAYTWVFRGSLVAMSGCAAFAAIIQDEVFGTIKECPVSWQAVTKDCPTVGMAKNDVLYSWDNLMPGDILVQNGHTVIVTQRFDDYVSIAEGNYCGHVNWDRTMSRNYVETYTSYIWTRWDKTGPFLQFAPPEKTHYSYDAFKWAEGEDILSLWPYGTDVKTECSRAEVVYGLWRLAGAPEVTGSVPFKDVSKSAPYYDAVVWAYSVGVTAGTGPTEFSPDMICTRCQIVMFLWRLCGSSESSLENMPFDDVADDRFYWPAVLWAYELGVTAGTSEHTFSPKRTCTHSEFYTFLYRVMEAMDAQ